MAGKVLVGKVDATVEGELAKRYKISGFPTVKLFKHGSEAGAYQGEKTELSLVEWVDTQTDNTRNLAGNVIQQVETCKDLTVRDAGTQEQVRYIGLFSTNTSTEFTLLETVDGAAEEQSGLQRIRGAARHGKALPGGSWVHWRGVLDGRLPCSQPAGSVGQFTVPRVDGTDQDGGRDEGAESLDDREECARSGRHRRRLISQVFRETAASVCCVYGPIW